MAPVPAADVPVRRKSYPDADLATLLADRSHIFHLAARR
jgi:hypothetical protein